MKYYATIYIDPIFDFEGVTHAFLGLTKGKNPDELDEIDTKIENDKLKNADWEKIGSKWYHTKEVNEFNDGFWGFGTGTTSIVDTAGKVFENNHYVVDNDTKTNTYNVKKLRSTKTFSKTNRCVLEISKEQYTTLFKDIQHDVFQTSFIGSQGKMKNENFIYDITNNNCVNWVIQKLSNIGIELIDEDYMIPGNFMDIFNYIQKIHSTFLKFQAIDENLKSIKGAKAFRMWARKLLDSMNRFMQSYCVVAENKVQSNRIPNSERFVILIESISLVYLQLDKILQSMLKNIDIKNIKGDFIFVYWDKTARDMKVLDKEHDYQAYTKKEFDLSNPAYNFSVCKFAPFIFIPNDKTLSQRLYHKYDYSNVSKQYQIARNEFYQNVLAGIQSDKYWSSSYHKLTKNLSKNEISKVANA